MINTDYLVDEPDTHLQSLSIRLPKKAVTILQLIKLKIAQEIHAFNDRRLRSYGADYLSTEEYQDILKEGREFFGDTLIKGKSKPEKEAKEALRAYANARFHIEFNGKIHTIKNSTIVINEQSKIRFVRLFPYT